jgi:hypothetical protein
LEQETWERRFWNKRPDGIALQKPHIPGDSFSPSRHDPMTYLRKYKTVSNGHKPLFWVSVYLLWWVWGLVKRESFSSLIGPSY